MSSDQRRVFRNHRLTYRLAVVAETAINANETIFQEMVGLGIRELRVLRLIDDNLGISFVDISAATAIERSRTSRIIQRLMNLGLVSRQISHSDGRRYRLFTTDAGKERRHQGRAVSDSLEEILQHQLDATEVAALARTLERVAVWISSDDYASQLADYRKRNGLIPRRRRAATRDE